MKQVFIAASVLCSISIAASAQTHVELGQNTGTGIGRPRNETISYVSADINFYKKEPLVYPSFGVRLGSNIQAGHYFGVGLLGGVQLQWHVAKPLKLRTALRVAYYGSFADGPKSINMGSSIAGEFSAGLFLHDIFAIDATLQQCYRLTGAAYTGNATAVLLGIHIRLPNDDE